MSTLHFIIGREQEASGSKRICIISQQTKSEYFVEGPMEVPTSISREHCMLSIDIEKGEQSNIVLRNLNAKNSTWVNGLEIQAIHVTSNDKVGLSLLQYPLDLNLVLKAIAPELPIVYSIAHLKRVWNKYQEEKINIQIKQSRSAAIQSVTGVLTLLAIISGSIVGIRILQVFLYVIAGLLTLFFFIYRVRHAGEGILQQKKLDDQFHKEYVCPNPDCRRFLGYLPYDDLMKTQPSCPLPKCKAIYKS